MTVSVLASGQVGSDGTGNISGTHNPGVGVTPHAVVVFVVMNGSSATNQIGDVTYGGVTMSSTFSASDTSTEPGRVQAYYLDARHAIPAGSATVEFTANNTNSTRRLYCVSLQSSEGGLGWYNGATDSQDQANPSNAFSVGADYWAAGVAALFSGNTAASISVADGAELAEANFSGNAQAASLIWSNATVNNGTLTMGWTVASDDVAAVYLLFAERVVVSGTVTHSGSPVEGAEINGVIRNSTGDSNLLGTVLAALPVTDASGDYSLTVQKGAEPFLFATYEDGGDKYTAPLQWGLDTTP